MTDPTVAPLMPGADKDLVRPLQRRLAKQVGAIMQETKVAAIKVQKKMNTRQMNLCEIVEWYCSENKGKNVVPTWRFVSELGITILHYCKYNRADLGENLRYYVRSVKNQVVGGMEKSLL